MGIIIKKPLGASLAYSPHNDNNDTPNNLKHSFISGSVNGNIKYYSSPSELPDGSIFKSGEKHTSPSGYVTSEEIKDDIQLPLGASNIYGNIVSNTNLDTSLISPKSNPFASGSNYHHVGGNRVGSVYSFAQNKFDTSTVDESIGGAYTYLQDELIKGNEYSPLYQLKDFREVIRTRIKSNPTAQLLSSVILSDSPDYSTKNIEKRVNLGDPGKSSGKNLKSYVGGYNGSGAASSNSYDKITHKELTPIRGGEDVNDLVKFRIGAINTDSPDEQIYMYFRAFLNGINDSYTGNWDSVNYVGRGENFYNYTGFDRKVSLSFTVAAQSKIELIPMYKKLNYLASQLAPDYSKNGYMRGPLITLTIGGYFYEQPGFLTGLTYDLSEESPWEIGIPDDSNVAPFYDSTVKELPHMIKVSNFSFTPIHNFVPKKADWKNLGNTPLIALSNGANTNY